MEQTKPLIRASDSPISAGEGRTIEGYAIVFGAKSVRMYDWMRGWVYEEYIDRDAITQDLIDKSDVKALIDHDRSRLLARSVNGEGSLKLELDERGLKFSFDVPNTTAGNDVLELVKRGDMTGCSFAFRCDEERDVWEKNGKIAKCTRKKITGLYDVSVVLDPAYQDTDVSARSRSVLESYLKEDGDREGESEGDTEGTPAPTYNRDYQKTIDNILNR